jgi:hypothetical protein
MIEVSHTVRKVGKEVYLRPLPQDADKAAEWHHGQIVRGKYTVAQQPRNLRQHGLVWACASLVADNSDEGNWSTAEKVMECAKRAIGFFDEEFTIVAKNGDVIMRTASISFRKLGQQKANKVITDLIEIMARKLGVEPEMLVEEAKRRMG